MNLDLFDHFRLADRVDIIRKWKDTLERTLAELDKEIADLNMAKEETEQALENMNLPTEVNVENLTTREGRQSIDVVEDEVEDELLRVRAILDQNMSHVNAQQINFWIFAICVLVHCRSRK